MAASGPEGEREIVVSREVLAPRELVFEAFTEVRHLAQWWGPTGFSASTRAFEFSAGGVWEFVLHGPDGTEYPNWITWREIVPPERIALLHGAAADDPEAFESTITFTDRGDVTEVVLRSVFRSRELRDRAVREYQAVEGGRQTLGRLAGYLAGVAEKGTVR